MTSKIAGLIGKKILNEHVSNQFGTDDPYFEMVPATRLDGSPSGKLKKQRKALPPGISKHDAKVLTKVKRRAYRLDMCLFNCLGIRFGWSSVIGIIPGIGDAFDVLLALMVLRTCQGIEGGLPSAVRAKMIGNIIFDFVIGIVPFVGDLVDAAFKANTRNAALLEAHLREKGKKDLRKSGLPVPEIDPSLPEEFDRAQRDPSPDHVATQPRTHERMTTGVMRESSRRNNNTNNQSGPTSPAPARVRRDDSRRGFFSGRSRPTDVEMGQPSRNPTSGSRRQR